MSFLLVAALKVPENSRKILFLKNKYYLFSILMLSFLVFFVCILEKSKTSDPPIPTKFRLLQSTWSRLDEQNPVCYFWICVHWAKIYISNMFHKLLLSQTGIAEAVLEAQVFISWHIFRIITLPIITWKMKVWQIALLWACCHFFKAVDIHMQWRVY